MFCFVHKGLFEQNYYSLQSKPKQNLLKRTISFKGINFALEKYNRIVSQIQLQGVQNNNSSRQLLRKSRYVKPRAVVCKTEKSLNPDNISVINFRFISFKLANLRTAGDAQLKHCLPHVRQTGENLFCCGVRSLRTATHVNSELSKTVRSEFVMI